MIQQGGQGALAQLAEFRKYSAEVMARETTTYDFEKVFIQSIYGIGLYFVMKAAWHLYWIMKQAAFMASNPDAAIAGVLDTWTFFSPPLLNTKLAWDLLTGDEITDAEKAWDEEVENDPLHFLRPIFEDYWFLFLGGIILFVGILEKRRVDRLKRKAKLMLKAFGR